MKTLFICLSAIGDTVMALPAICEYIKINNLKDVHILTRNKEWEQIFFLNKDFKDLNYKFYYTTTSKLYLNLPLISVLRKEKYNVAICLYPHKGIASALFMFLIGAGQRIQHAYRFKFFNNINWFLTSKVEYRYEHNLFNNERLLEITRQLSYNCLGIEKHGKKSNEIKEKVIGIHAGCGQNQYWRRWPVENWARLINLILENTGYSITMFWGPDELDLFYKYFRQKDNRITHIINSSLTETINLIANCDFFISNDSGLAHIASLFEIKQVTIFGPADEHISGPINKYGKIIRPFNSKPDYLHYKKYKQPKKNILNDLSVQDVYFVFLEMIDYKTGE
ncbi:MAG: glycosyltransferase family 9 protein [Candidatus Margulisbacteria bacterium]|nr:glycosyltransferase family 9 protein [Candidatus Margulisiibacteriota bacterium]